MIHNGLSFAPEDSVSLQLADAGIAPLMQDITSTTNIDPHVDQVDMSDNSASITETQAATLIDAGLHFAADDVVDMQAEGTHLSTSLKDLHDLGVDQVSADAAAAAGVGHDIVLALGIDASAAPSADLVSLLSTFQAPLFTPSADVELTVANQTMADAIVNNPNVVTQLLDLGVDYVKVVGTAPDVEDNLHNHQP
jgi:hypothetical protein